MTLPKKSILGALGSEKIAPLPQRTLCWKGPEEDGVTQTMLSHYIVCPERFRVMYVEGLQPIKKFDQKIEFGNMWHAAEEAFAAHGSSIGEGGEPVWTRAVYDYGNGLGKRFPDQREDIIHWLRMTVALFPTYIDYWKHHPDVLASSPLMQEEKFSVPYNIGQESSRTTTDILYKVKTVKLRGKWDSVDLVKRGKEKTVWLQENKTKSTIDSEKLRRQLKYDLQTMLYIIALQAHLNMVKIDVPWSIGGVRYNVIRRSSHKTPESMMKKVHEDIKDGRVGEWLSRWNVDLSDTDIYLFRHYTLHPLLLNLCDDYEWWKCCYQTNVDVFSYDYRSRHFPHHQRRHFITPYIGYNPLGEGGEGALDHFIFTGNTLGLEYVTHADLFPELT